VPPCARASPLAHRSCAAAVGLTEVVELRRLFEHVCAHADADGAPPDCARAQEPDA